MHSLADAGARKDLGVGCCLLLSHCSYLRFARLRNCPRECSFFVVNRPLKGNAGSLSRIDVSGYCCC